MKCPNCGAEVREEDKFCGECGKHLQREIEIAPKWKWGSMVASLVLIFSWLFFYGGATFFYGGIFQYNAGVSIVLLGFPATIYHMYKERTGKMKYGLAWISFPILIFLFCLWGIIWCYAEGFVFFAIPAILIDVIYVYKTRHKEVKNV